MFSVSKKVVVTATVQNFNIIPKNTYKVSVIGAAGGIGQPLSMLLKINPNVTNLSLYDVNPVTKGVGADVSHINTPSRVFAYAGDKELCEAVCGADLVIVPAGIPRKPEMTRDDLFKTNASVVMNVTKMCAAVAPCAVMAIITNPVNSTVPIAIEVHKRLCTYDPRKVIGVTTLDVVRASTFVGEKLCVDPRVVDVPVIGGHSGITIVPLLSQSNPNIKLDQAQLEGLTKRIQEGGTEVVKAKAGGGSATLSMAIAAARIASAILRGFNGESPIEAAYVENRLTPARYFATRCLFGRNGVEACYHFGTLSKYETSLYDKMLPELVKNIETGEKFVQENFKC